MRSGVQKNTDWGRYMNKSYSLKQNGGVVFCLYKQIAARCLYNRFIVPFAHFLLLSLCLTIQPDERDRLNVNQQNINKKTTSTTQYKSLKSEWLENDKRKQITTYIDREIKAIGCSPHWHMFFGCGFFRSCIHWPLDIDAP